MATVYLAHDLKHDRDVPITARLSSQHRAPHHANAGGMTHHYPRATRASSRACDAVLSVHNCCVTRSSA